MASIFEDQDFADFRELFNDIMDTFLRIPAVYKKDKNTATLFMRDIGRVRGTEDVNINILAVWDSNEKEIMDKTASVNMLEGYILVKFDDCLANGILSTTHKNLKINVPQDTIVFKGVAYSVTGATLLGQWKDQFTIVKFHISKNMGNNDGGYVS